MHGRLVRSPSGHVSGARIDHLMRPRATTPRSGHRSRDRQPSTTNRVHCEKLLVSKENLVPAGNMHQMKYAALLTERRISGMHFRPRRWLLRTLRSVAEFLIPTHTP